MENPAPCPANDFLSPHVRLLRNSLRRLTGRELAEAALDDAAAAKSAWEAPFVLLSHDAQADPVFTYGNRTALELFEMTWDQLVSTHSRFSAEAPNREERARLLAEVNAHGFIDDYSGIRISRSGRRFVIDHATVWNLLDDEGTRIGQAAMFSEWRFL
jgi:hypothetical protein